MNKKFTGTISISRSFGGDKSQIHISIQEEHSRVEFFDGHMSLEDFGAAVTGASFRPIEFEFRPDKVGWKAENKTELVPRVDLISNKKTREQLIKKALEPFEVDGWSARESDMENCHCRVGDFQRVVFFRHVPHETTPAQ